MEEIKDTKEKTECANSDEELELTKEEMNILIPYCTCMNCKDFREYNELHRLNPYRLFKSPQLTKDSDCINSRTTNHIVKRILKEINKK